jgi:tetratricopeptide (TPR) repeat protein
LAAGTAMAHGDVALKVLAPICALLPAELQTKVCSLAPMLAQLGDKPRETLLTALIGLMFLHLTTKKEQGEQEAQAKTEAQLAEIQRLLKGDQADITQLQTWAINSQTDPARFAQLDDDAKTNPNVLIAFLLRELHLKLEANQDPAQVIMDRLEVHAETFAGLIYAKLDAKLTPEAQASLGEPLSEDQRNTLEAALLDAMQAQGQAMQQELARQFDNQNAPQLLFKPEPLDTRAGQESSVYNLVYRRTLVPELIGRTDEEEQIQKFLDQEEKFSWMMVVGQGGSGKSRLAFQALLERMGQWQGGELRGNLPDRLHTWTPEKDTLIILDYVAAKAPSIGQALRQWAVRAPELKDKVRVILLERYYLPVLPWAKALLLQGNEYASTVASAAFPVVPEGGQYGPVVLRALDAEAMQTIFVRSYERLKQTACPAEVARLALKLFEDPKFQRRSQPIYASGAALVALQQPEAFATLTPHDLIRHILDHERDLWQKLHATEADVNVVTLATLGDGLRVPVDPACPPLQGHDLARCRQLVGQAEQGPRLLSLQPDLIGGGLVAGRLAGSFALQADAIEVQTWAGALLDLALATPLDRQDAAEAGPDPFLVLLAQDQLHVPQVFAAFFDRWDRLPPAVLRALVQFAHAAGPEAVARVVAKLREQGRYDLLGALVEGGQVREQEETVDFGIVLDGDTLRRLADIDAALRKAEPLLESRLLRQAAPWLAQARERLEQLDLMLRRSVPARRLEIVILCLEGDAELQRGQAGPALERYGRALGLARTLAASATDTASHEDRRLYAVMLERTADVLLQQGDTEGALVRYEESLALCRRVLEIVGDRNPQALRDVSVALEKTADVHLRQGDAEGALVRYEESLALRRRVLEIVGERDPQALRDVSISLERTADVLLRQGDAVGALARYEESLALRRQVRQIVGERDPQALRDVSISLDRTADVLLQQGDAVGALARYEESLALRRQVRQIVGERDPQALRDVSISLIKSADVLLQQGDAVSALARYEESLALCRQVRQIVGERDPQALRDVSISLDRTADVLLQQGDAVSALARYEESLALCRQVRQIVGERDPQALRDVSISLNKTADVLLQQGDAVSALARYEESLQICRQVHAIVGDRNPQALRDVSISLDKTADVLLRQGDAEGALTRYEESLQICRQVHAIVGPLPEAKRDVFVSLTKIASVIRKQDPSEACRFLLDAKTIAHDLAATYPAFVQYAQDYDWVLRRLEAWNCDDME